MSNQERLAEVLDMIETAEHRVKSAKRKLTFYNFSDEGQMRCVKEMLLSIQFLINRTEQIRNAVKKAYEKGAL